MRKQRAILTTGLIIILCALIYYLTRPPDPLYEGRRLSEWLEDLKPPLVGSATQFIEETTTDDPMHTKAVVAIQRLGTNSLPYLKAKLTQIQTPIFDYIPSFILNRTDLLEKWHLSKNRYLYALYVLGPEAVEAAPLLLQYQIYRPDPLCDSVWSRIGPEAAPYLIQQAGSQDKLRADFAVWGLSELRPISDEMVHFFIGHINDPAARTRREAASGLAYATNHSDIAVPVLIKCLSDSHEEVQRNAIYGFHMHKKKVREGAPELLNVALNQKSENQFLAAQTLTILDPQLSTNVLPLFQVKLSSKEWYTREASLKAVTRMGPFAKPLLPSVTNAVNDTEVDVRKAATNALQAIAAASAEHSTPAVLP